MLTNLESQLKQQNAADKLDLVLAEIPRVREDLGFLPLVTPTSQIVGTQAVLNVLTGERYKNIAKETAGVLKGEYGATPAPVNAELQQRVLNGELPITCRPADNLKPEMETLEESVIESAAQKGVKLSENIIDDVLTVALFPQIAWKFLENRGNPAAFEPHPQVAPAVVPPTVVPAAKEKVEGPAIYTIEVEGRSYVVKVSEGGEVRHVQEVSSAVSPVVPAPAVSAANAVPVAAPLAGNIWKVVVKAGQAVKEGDVLVILEAMKMETEIRAGLSGTVNTIQVKEGDAVAVGDCMLTLV